MANNIADDNTPYKLLVEQSSTPSSPAAGKQIVYIRTIDNKLCRVNSSGAVTVIESGGGGAPTTAEYLTTASDGTLSAEVVIPGLAGHRDVSASGGAGTSEEYDTSTTGLSWSPSTPDTVDSDTTRKSHLYIKSTDATERLGTKSWSPAGAFSVIAKMSLSNKDAEGTIGLHIGDSGNSNRLLLLFNPATSTQKMTVVAYTYAASTYTQRGSTWNIQGPTELYFRIDRDGSNNITFLFSSDGYGWRKVATQAFTLTVENIGFRSSDAAHEAYVDFLRTDV